MLGEDYAVLYDLLQHSITNQTSDTVQLAKLQQKLQQATGRFLSLLDIQPRNPKERQQLESGTFTFFDTGSTFSAGPALAQEILFLSDSLGASEHLCASYIHQGINSSTRTADRARAESGLRVFLSERATLLECLKLIWSGALASDEGLEGTGIQNLLKKMTEELTKGKGADVLVDTRSSTRGTWVQKILASIKASTELIATLSAPAGAGGAGSLVSLKPLGGVAQNVASFSSSTAAMRIQFHAEERILLSQLLFLICTAHQLTSADMFALLSHLQQVPTTDPTVVYLLVATLASISTSDHTSRQQLYPFLTSSSFIDHVHQVLAADWLVPHIRATVRLQWTVFLETAKEYDQDLETDGGEHVDSLTWSAITTGVFGFLGRAVLSYKWDDVELYEVWADVGYEIEPIGAGHVIESSYEGYVTAQIEALVVDIISTKLSILRKLRNKEEDVASYSHRGGGHRGASARREEQEPVEERHDLESLFLLLATIYHNAPDASLKFWEDESSYDAEMDESSGRGRNGGATTSRLAAFLRWGAECNQPGSTRAYYEMVASLASGPISSTCAYRFLSANESTSAYHESAPSSSFSWATLFGALDYYHQNLSTLDSNGQLSEMPPSEVPLLQSFVRLLRQVVKYSPIARATLYDHRRYKPIATLFALLGQAVSINLKASLLEGIAAFGQEGGGAGVEVKRRIWVALEASQILPTREVVKDVNGRRSQLESMDGGILSELVSVETPGKMYPGSTAFVHLLSTLLHSSTASSSRSSLQHHLTLSTADSQTIPDNLGALHRAPGIDPYVRFVVDDVFLLTREREFADPKEVWRVNEAALEFVEKCLGSYDLGPFLAAAAVGGRAGTSGSGPTSPLGRLVLHPGFELLTRLLEGGPLLLSILTIVKAGNDAIEADTAGTPMFTVCVLRCLRILKRVLDLQSPFLEVVLPSLGQSNVQIPREKLNRLGNLAPLDQSLLYNSKAIVQIALLVACEKEDEIALLAVQILAIVAESSSLDLVQSYPANQARSKRNRLVGLLEASPETLRIIDAFVVRLGTNVPESDLEVGEWDGVEGQGSIRQAIKSAILDLLLQSTQPDRAGPNLAHLLLGFNVQGRPRELEIDDPDMADTQRNALHVILELLALNASPDEDAELSLLAFHPTFAAKCYRLVRQLCLHQYTSAALSRYLRNREKYFLQQSLAMPFEVPSASQGSLGQVVYTDGRKIVTSCAALCAILQSEAWLLESTALELNVLAEGNDTHRELELLGALFGNSNSILDDGAIDGGSETVLPRMLEIFHAFDFDWADSIQPNSYRINLFADLRFETCLKMDSAGCELYDFTALVALIGAARRELQNRGVLNTQAQEDEIRNETRCVVETFVIENHAREIQFARLHALKAWRSLLDITITKALHLLPADNRHPLLLDLMTAILRPISAPSTDPAIGELLSGAAVLLMTKLRDEAIRIVASEGGEGSQLISPDPLHAILRTTLYAIVQSGLSAVVRGNLYAVLLNYIQYSAKMSTLSPPLAKSLGDESMSVASDDLVSFDGLSSVGGTRKPRRNALENGNLVILQSALERLLPIICRDAAAGQDVWRTVAFTALDALVMVAEEGRATSKVLSILSKQGYLQSFIGSLKAAEVDLLESLKPDPESLNALYIYEAQMSFLIRLSSTREGAGKLLSAELLGTLAQCDYLGARPQADPSSMEFDGFLPPATERHHQLLLPALQLVVGSVLAFGSETTIAIQQALTFVGGQRETLIIALRDCTVHQTVASIKEAHLIVTLLGIVLPLVTDEALSTIASFGGLHAALVGLSSRLCGSENWIAHVAPSNDAERDESTVQGHQGTVSVYTEKLETMAEALQGSILSYLSVATRKQPGMNVFKAVYAPSFQTEQGAVPTLGSAAAFLRSTAVTLAARLGDVARIAHKMENFETGDIDEMDQSLVFVEEGATESADRRRRIHARLLALQNHYRAQVSSSLHLIEIALLVFYRHTANFLDPERAETQASSRPDFGLGLAESLRTRGTQSMRVDESALRADLLKEFRPTADILGNLELTQTTVGPTFRARESYFGTISRRMQDLLLLPL